MRKVLLVDFSAHKDACTTVAPDWSHLGFVVGGEADTVAQAMNVLSRERFSLVVIVMCKADAEGMTLCKQIRRMSRMPIIMAGGREDFHLARKAMHYQVSDYLPAPFTAAELAASLEAVALHVEPVADENGDGGDRGDGGTRQSSGVISKVKEFVEESLHQNITLKEISSMMHFNCSYLGQKFKDHENMTFHEYLLQRRMEKAKHLLEHTDMKIYEVANKVGYTEIDWFYKKFKCYTGVSANAYRKLHSITA